MPLMKSSKQNEEGMVTIKIDPGQVKMDKKGRIVITDPDLSKFLKNNPKKATANLQVMGSACGCKCCCGSLELLGDERIVSPK